VNYELLYRMELEAHNKTIDVANEDILRLIREKQKVQKELESLKSLLESKNDLIESLMKKENQQVEDYKLVKVEYYA
jgi:Mg2+ and Co2+ transporter CorA